MKMYIGDIKGVSLKDINQLMELLKKAEVATFEAIDAADRMVDWLDNEVEVNRWKDIRDEIERMGKEEGLNRLYFYE